MYKCSYYNTYVDFSEGYIVFNSLSSKLLFFDSALADRIKRILDNVNEETGDCYFEELKKYGFIVPETLDEMELVREIENKTYINKDELFLIILPTEQCNFRCKYCYENFIKKEMSEQTQIELIEFVKRRLPYVKSMYVEWFGGEPLLSENVISNLSTAFISMCRENGIPYIASMTTNGYLLDAAMVKRLKKFNVLNYQITIDGLADTHDNQRVKRDGSGSWNKIVSNLRDIRDHVNTSLIKIMLRTNLTKPIVANIGEYLDFLEREFGHDSKFHFLWRMAGDWDNMQDPSIESQFCSLQDYYDILKLASTRGLSNRKLRDMFVPGGLVCYAAKCNSYVFGSDGVVHKCTLGLDETKNNLGTINEIDGICLDGWVYERDFLDEKCIYCKRRPICQGVRACPNSGICICNPDMTNFEEILVDLVRSNNKVIKYYSE